MTLHDFKLTSANQTSINLNQYSGKVVLVVNVASQCGFTPQYEGLEKLFQRYREQGLAIIALPCNQFGKQEPGDDESIQKFCASKFDVTFDVFKKIEVNGPQADPLFAWLKDQAKGLLGSKSIKWNFTKFLVRRNGEVFKRYSPITKPDALISDIEFLLKEA